ncbi:MAG: hypothetical protein JW742_01330 [Candidatus Aminicenantes bacterium]|nr:hypothetical protein [Candidatus Aminicenantes bacterium]
MKTTAWVISFWLAAAPAGIAPAQDRPDERLFRDAKLLLFDKQWAEAQTKLEEIIGSHPASPLRGQALFYRAKCLNERKGLEREALIAYKDYLGLRERNESLAEEAENSIIELAMGLYERGDKVLLQEVESRLDHRNRAIQYYAAFKLSYAADKAVAAKSVPVLKSIIASERNAELKDRAKIALLRISPQTLKGVPDDIPVCGPRVLKIRIYEKGGGEPRLSLNIPWALADLALSAFPEEDKAKLRRKGYNIDTIIRDLTRNKEAVFEIIDEDEGRIKIWIE